MGDPCSKETNDKVIERLRAAARKACERHNRVDQFDPTWERKSKDFIEWEAADAIEWLEAEIDRFCERACNAENKLADAQAEIERLRRGVA